MIRYKNHKKISKVSIKHSQMPSLNKRQVNIIIIRVCKIKTKKMIVIVLMILWKPHPLIKQKQIYSLIKINLMTTY